MKNLMKSPGQQRRTKTVRRGGVTGSPYRLEPPAHRGRGNRLDPEKSRRPSYTDERKSPCPGKEFRKGKLEES